MTASLDGRSAPYLCNPKGSRKVKNQKQCKTGETIAFHIIIIHWGIQLGASFKTAATRWPK